MVIYTLFLLTNIAQKMKYFYNVYCSCLVQVVFNNVKTVFYTFLYSIFLCIFICNLKGA